MENDDWDLFSIVRSCKATTTFTTPAIVSETPPQTLPITTTMTNNIISPQNTTQYCYDDYTFTQKNCTIPISPLKPNDFIELDKLILRSNLAKIIPTPSTTNILTPSIITTITPALLTTTTIFPTPSTITTPTHITTNTITDTSFHGSDQNSTFSYFPTHIEQKHMQPSEFTHLEQWIHQFNPPTTIPVSTITILNSTTPTTITPITTTITFSTPPTTINTPTTTSPIIPTTTTIINSSVNGLNQYITVSDFSIPSEQQQVQANPNKTTIPKFHCEFDHELVPQQPQRNQNQLPIQLQTSFRALPNTNPKQTKFKSGKRKNDNQVSLVSYVGADKVSEDSWRWRKYGQKPIKGSSHPRSYYKCSSSSDCLARKQVEKIKDGDDTYEVTYLGEHNHNKPAINRNSAVGSSRYMSPKSVSVIDGEARCFTNIGNLGSPNAVMLHLDQPESSKARVLVGQSKIPNLETELIDSPLPTLGKSKSPQIIEELDSPSMMMLPFDEEESENSNIFSYESEIPYTEAEFIESSKEDDILIPNMTPMLEEFFLDFNNVNSGPKSLSGFGLFKFELSSK